jgi:hypothetical protein
MNVKSENCNSSHKCNASLVVIIVAESFEFSSQSTAFFAFGGMLGVVLILFVYIARRYKYVAFNAVLVLIRTDMPQPEYRLLRMLTRRPWIQIR